MRSWPPRNYSEIDVNGATPYDPTNPLQLALKPISTCSRVAAWHLTRRSSSTTFPDLVRRQHHGWAVADHQRQQGGRGQYVVWRRRSCSIRRPSTMASTLRASFAKKTTCLRRAMRRGSRLWLLLATPAHWRRCLWTVSTSARIAGRSFPPLSSLLPVRMLRVWAARI